MLAARPSCVLRPFLACGSSICVWRVPCAAQRRRAVRSSAALQVPFTFAHMLRCINQLSADVHESSNVADGRGRRHVSREADAG